MDMEEMAGQHYPNLDILIDFIYITSFCLRLRLILYPLSIFVRTKFNGATKLMLLELMATLELCMLNYYIMGGTYIYVEHLLYKLFFRTYMYVCSLV